MVISKKASEPQVELHPDAWARFERAAEVVVKSPPQHRAKAKSKKTSSGLKRAPRKPQAK